MFGWDDFGGDGKKMRGKYQRKQLGNVFGWKAKEKKKTGEDRLFSLWVHQITISPKQSENKRENFCAYEKEYLVLDALLLVLPSFFFFLLRSTYFLYSLCTYFLLLLFFVFQLAPAFLSTLLSSSPFSSLPFFFFFFLFLFTCFCFLFSLLSLSLSLSLSLLFIFYFLFF